MKTMMKMNRLAAIVAPLALLAGCAQMEGKWSVSSVDPTAARRDFAFESLTLQGDGTYYAEAKTIAGAEAVSGTWELNDGVLALKGQNGETHTYDAELEHSDKHLILVRHWDGQHLTAVLKKRATQ